MGDVLGRKQRIQNSDWIDAFEKIEQLVSKEELDQLVEKTVREIKKKTKGKKNCLCMERWKGFAGAWGNLPEGRDNPLRACNLQFGVQSIYRMGRTT